MGQDPGKRLFHTIVVVGAALGGCSSNVVPVESDAASKPTTDAGEEQVDGNLIIPPDSTIVPPDAGDDVSFPHITK